MSTEWFNRLVLLRHASTLCPKTNMDFDIGDLLKVFVAGYPFGMFFVYLEDEGNEMHLYPLQALN